MSAPEALAQLPEVIRIRLSGGPDTKDRCAILIRNPRTSLLFTGPESLFEVRCVATAHKKLPTAKPLTGFLLKPVDVRDKRAPYATLLSGIQFALHNTLEIEAQWKEAQRALLRTFPVSYAYS